MLLERHKMWHVANGGTLIGAVRNKGIIPHDNDMDLNFLHGHFNNSKAFQSDLKKNGLFLFESKFFRWFKRVCRVDHPGFCVDLFGLVKRGGKLVYPGCPEKCTQASLKGKEWPASIAEEGALIQWPFGGTTVPAPPRKITEAYLTYVYGRTWRTEASCGDPKKSFKARALERGGTWHHCYLVQDLEYDLTGRALPDSPLKDPI